MASLHELPAVPASNILCTIAVSDAKHDFGNSNDVDTTSRKFIDPNDCAKYDQSGTLYRIEKCPRV